MAEPLGLKIVIVGDGGVGKSSWTMGVLNRDFSDEYDPTVEDSYTTRLAIEGKEYSIEIIDTAGQEEYRGAWEEATAREGDGFIIAYSVDSMSSFEQLSTFLHIIRRVKSPFDDPTREDTPENTPFPFLILGNKCDKPQADRKVPTQVAYNYARSAGGLFTECSAKMGVNVESAFVSIVKAAATAKLSRKEWLKTHRGDDRNWSGNVAMMDRPSPPAGVRVEIQDEKKIPRKKNANLGMDRSQSMSMGAGLADGNGKKGGCGCLLM